MVPPERWRDTAGPAEYVGIKGKNIKSKRSQIDKSPEGVIIYHLTSEIISGNGVFSFAHDLRK